VPGCRRGADAAPGDFPREHIDGIETSCDRPVRFAVVESIDTTITTVRCRARGMSDDETLPLKLHARPSTPPIRSGRFSTGQPLYKLALTRHLLLVGDRVSEGV
jgi:hypothetical protein